MLKFKQLMIVALVSATFVGIVAETASAQDRLIGIYFRPREKSYNRTDHSRVNFAISEIARFFSREVGRTLRARRGALVTRSTRPDSFFRLGLDVIRLENLSARDIRVQAENKILFAADITINRAVAAFAGSNRAMFSDFNGVRGRSLSAIGGGAHEFGHQLGLRHPSSSEGDLSNRLMQRQFFLPASQLVSSEVSSILRDFPEYFE